MGKYKRKKRQAGILGRRQKTEVDREEAEELVLSLAMLAVAVEAAGGLERAIRLSQMEEGSPEAEALRNITPIRRGGQNDAPDADQMWDELLESAIGSYEGRRVMMEMQQTFEEMEHELITPMV